MKKFLISILSLAMLFCIGIAAAGCADEKPNEEPPKEEIKEGTFYTLQEAYDLELVTTEDIKSIANYHNNGLESSEKLTEAEEAAIKQTAAYNARNDEKSPVPEAKAEDYVILKYYGNYNGSYAVILNYPYGGFPGVVVDEWVAIDSVDIHYTNHYKIVIWTAKTPLSNWDKNILEYYREPSIDDNFIDNEVIVIYKSAYSYISEVSFDDFKIVESVCELSAIKYSWNQKITKTEEILKLDEEKNHMITLELTIHDKEKVLEVIGQLKNLDMVLVAEPNYIYEIFLDEENITAQTHEKLNQDFLRQYGYEFSYDRFYGAYGDCAAFFVAGDSAVIKEITVADAVFQYNYDWEIYVWNNGQFSTIEEAYSMGWLTSDDVHSIADRHAAAK